MEPRGIVVEGGGDRQGLNKSGNMCVLGGGGIGDERREKESMRQ